MGRLTRRQMLAHSLALTSAGLLTACGGGGSGSGGTTTPTPTPPPPPPPPPPAGIDPIREAAAAKNMTFGTAIDINTYGDANYRTLAEEHCNNLVAENSHKWEAIRPTPNVFNFGNGDQLTDYAASENIEIRYHTLLWEAEERYPDWFDTYDFGSDPATEAERLLTDHIQTAARRYGGQITSWDVVNEAVDPGTGDYRSSPFSRNLGSMEAVLDIAFNTARAELPSAQLVYNDYMSWNGNSLHHDGVLRLLEGLLNRGTPIDALGIQGHIWGGNSGGFGANETEWRTFLDEVTGMGLDLLITEFDVDDSQLPAAIATRDQLIAEVTTAYLDLMFDYPQLKDCLCWGLVHRYSWLQGFRPRSDGLANRPTPFDDNYDPTPMAEAILAAYEATSVRT